ncbi:unnamed protein product [Darwinula stevensoni]|uniref:Protein farnesyltransferase/geranylgeranyltransferase type-1 subunit alpha n=1 Tax=Darwinula stevensoni TaxID=69355 RepID=A0A7R8ZZ66_9CRUS|nr:unnamed protein product [Darwinula stevensoni]CAG0881913.1 unnamed protein product [Darwinula stevensoni]
MSEFQKTEAGTEDEEDFTFYRDRPEWKDVKPVPQDDGPHAVVAILYSEKFKDVHDYFRAVTRIGETSERALELTKDAIELNPANYTVWQYRRKLLRELGKDLYEELTFVRGHIEQQPKNYQVWHHRHVLVEWLQDPLLEKRFTEMMLSQDAKNYHAWQHRTWVVKAFQLYEGELDFTDQLLKEDVRNNSAWNYRFFLMLYPKKADDETAKKEILYTMKAISRVTHNESAWNYLRGLMVKLCACNPNVLDMIWDFCLELKKSGTDSPHLLAFMIDILDARMEASIENRQENLKSAQGLCRLLAQEKDKIREQYWLYQSDWLQCKYIPSSVDE